MSRRLEPSPEESLYHLLIELHGDDGESLIRFLQFGEQGDDVAANLPPKEASIARIAGVAVPLLKHRGLIGPTFFERLRRRFPQREPDIRTVRERWSTALEDRQAFDLGQLQPDLIDPQQFYRHKLSEAQRRKSALLDAGQSAVVVDAEIRSLKRQLREGNPPSQGDLLANRYWLLERVGAGGFGTVWLAKDETDGGRVAIKLLHPQESQDVSKRERFFRGARAMRRLDHPAIVKILDPECSEADTYFFVMEFIDGPNLERAILEKRLSRGQIFGVVATIGKALAHAHASGMVHRDVKPSNILIDSQGNPRLTDFDLVLADDTTGGTRQGGMGTFVYSAPEMYQDANTADHRADVFGLAMTTIFCLFGERLPLEVLRHEDRVFARLATSSRVKVVLRKAIEWSPVKRHQSMAEFCAELLAAARYRQAGLVELLVLGASALFLIVLLVLPEQPVVAPEPSAEPPANINSKVDTKTAHAVSPPRKKPDATLPSPAVIPEPQETKTEKPPDTTREAVVPPPDPTPTTQPEPSTKKPNRPSSKQPAEPTKQAPPETSTPKSISLTASAAEKLARECEEQRAPGAGCSGTVAVVHITLGDDGDISNAVASGSGSERELGQCIAARLKHRYTAESSGDREFTCD